MKKYWISIFSVALGICLAGQADVVAYYSFNDSGNMTVDDSGNGHTLGLAGGYVAPDYTADGKFGGGCDFDGSTQGWYISNYIYPQGSFSFSAWVKPESSSAMITCPWSLKNGFNISVVAGSYRFITYYGDSSLYNYISSGVAPVLDEWQHIAMTFEVTGGPDANSVYTGTLRAYINGESVGSYVGAQYTAPSGEDMGIGRRSTATFTGTMDEIGIYNTALSQGEIQALMVPEPGSVILLGFGSLAALFLRKLQI